RLATLLTSVFLRFALSLRLAFVLVANTTSLKTCALFAPVARSQRRVAPSSGPFHRHSGRGAVKLRVPLSHLLEHGVEVRQGIRFLRASLAPSIVTTSVFGILLPGIAVFRT